MECCPRLLLAVVEARPFLGFFGIGNEQEGGGGHTREKWRRRTRSRAEAGDRGRAQRSTQPAHKGAPFAEGGPCCLGLPRAKWPQNQLIQVAAASSTRTPPQAAHARRRKQHTHAVRVRAAYVHAHSARDCVEMNSHARARNRAT